MNFESFFNKLIIKGGRLDILEQSTEYWLGDKKDDVAPIEVANFLTSADGPAINDVPESTIASKEDVIDCPFEVIPLILIFQ